MGSRWCALCNKSDDDCDCVMMTAAEMHQLTQEWRNARLCLGEFWEGRAGHGVAPDDFPTLDRLIYTKDCAPSLPPSEISSEGAGDTCR